jgi:HAD superfamily hydrolase (TIGR01509 family)
MKKYILFDHDGVLVDTEHWYFMSNKQALSELGIDLDEDFYLKNMSKGISCWDIARASGIDESTIAKQIEKRNLYYQDYLKKEDIEIAGVETLLSQLSKDYKMAIITTAKRDDFEIIHKDRNVVQYMEFVLAREDYENAKPDPEPYLKGLKKFRAQKEEALIVEDSERGLKSAVAAGIDCVVVHNEFTKTHDFSKATHKIMSLGGVNI